MIRAAIRFDIKELWRGASLLLLGAALLTLAYLVAQIVLGVIRGELTIANAVAPSLFAATLYLLSHAMRILRLSLLIGGWRVGFRSVVTFHLMTSAVALAVPLKLGELYRVAELANLCGSAMKAIMIAWWERVFDVLALLVILMFAFANTPAEAHTAFYGIASLAAAFIIGTALVFFVSPENLRRLSVLIIRRYDHGWSVPLLKGIDAIRRAIKQAPVMVHKKTASLLTLTAIIWTCESACFALVFTAFSESIGAAFEGLLSFLSAITQGETLLAALTTSGGDAGLLPYLAVTHAPLAVIGLAAGLVYAAIRLKSSKDFA